MLKDINRLSLRYHRKEIENKGKSSRTPHFTLLYLTDPNLPSPQFAFLISKKTIKLSVARHALKRQLSQIIKDNLNLINPHLQLIIIPSYKSLNLEPPALKESLLYAISNLSL